MRTEQLKAELKEAGLDTLPLRHGFPDQWMAHGYCQRAMDILGFASQF